MSSEVYKVKLQLATGEQEVTSPDEHFGAVVCVFADNNTNSAETISSITDVSSGLNILGNADLESISADTGTAQYEQTEMGGTAVAGKLKLTLSTVAGTGTFDAYVYIAP
tara:strand:+ start:336 stop:665 length:330 start_codon:yes stop_codon:yes gene_type:complete